MPDQNQLSLPHTQPESTSPDPLTDAQRDEYRERLRVKLKDPEFRQIEGFPIGEDEAILALSDPPYYTACPNPFLPEIIEQWQQERAKLRAELGLPDDSQGNGPNNGLYHREPFASDVSEGKNDPIYNAHSYHTKVPHKAIMRYILHYTDPGDIVFDGFCGTGMTGVAAQLCGDKKEVEKLGYRVDDEGLIYDGDEAISRLGARKAVLNDLSPAATFIAYNYNTPVDVKAFEKEAKRILREVEEECGWMYETLHTDGKAKGRVNWIVWSDVFICPECGTEMVFWDVAIDEAEKKVLSNWPCPSCNILLAKSPKKKSGETKVERAWETVYDHPLGKSIRSAKQVPVLINYSVGKRRYEKSPDNYDLTLLRKIDETEILNWYPNDALPDGYNTRQPMESHNLTNVHQFYTRRSLQVFSTFWRLSDQLTFYAALLGGLSVGLKLARFRTPLWFNKTSGPMKGLTSGTLYVPSLSGEQNWINIFASRIAAIKRQLKVVNSLQMPHDSTINTASMTQVQFSKDTVDYIFTDPPFGGNLMYSEINFISEAWLRIITDNGQEAITNNVQAKGIPEYQRLMERCFIEYYRVLKSGHWMTVEFHNSQNRVWNAIQEALLRAGFIIADVRTLDKKQSSFKQVTTTSATKQDLVISAYKPLTSFEQRFLKEAGTGEGAWNFIRQHLAQLPRVVINEGVLEIIAERQDYLLFDRMVAFHIQRGASVPLSAAEFYAGLRERFIERDGMFFLPDQVLEYDQARLQAQEVAQLSLFMSDEKSAIQWLRQQLDTALGGHPQTYQDIQPQFLRELHQARHEALPELSEILEQNFLQADSGQWYVPDPNKASDLEKLRQKALLREFSQYLGGRGRLRQFRSEAIRAGFADAWQRRDYTTIVNIAERLPERVLQEDPDLLMYYDNASLRTD